MNFLGEPVIRNANLIPTADSGRRRPRDVNSTNERKNDRQRKAAVGCEQSEMGI